MPEPARERSRATTARGRRTIAGVPDPDLPPILPIRDGLFFTLPEALPIGRHKLPREQILEAQRERLMAAMTELLAARGYRGFGVGDVAKQARVSLAAFYQCFESKDDCVFAGYDRFIQILLQRMIAVEVPSDDRPALANALVHAYLDALQEDLVVARAYQVEIDSLGPPARERRRTSLTLFAQYIQQKTADLEALPWSAYLGVVYAARQLAVDALDTEPEPDLGALADDLEVWLVDLFRVRPH